MEILIDREKRIALLNWLRRGVVDSADLDKFLTKEEWDAQIDEMITECHDEVCERLQRLGFCNCKARVLTKQEAQDFFQQLEREY